MSIKRQKLKPFCIVVLIAMFFLSACQPTPENLIVQQKDGEKLMEKIENSEDEKGEEIIGNMPKDIENQSWIETIKGNTGKFECYIDAKVTVPKADKFTVTQVSPHTFTIEYINEFIDILAPNAKLLLHGNEGFDIPKTKEDIERTIFNLRQELNDSNSILNRLKKENYKSYESRLEAIEETLRECEETYADAPDEIEVKIFEITQELLDNGFRATTNTQIGYSNIEDIPDTSVSLIVSNSKINRGRANQVLISFSDSKYRENLQENPEEAISIEEAIDKAKEVVKDKLHINNMEMVFAEENRNGMSYQIIFMRTYGGVHTTYSKQDIPMSGNDNPDVTLYTAGWPYEKIILDIRKNGELRSYMYSAPLNEDKVFVFL